VQGNLARKLDRRPESSDIEFEEQYRRRRETEAELRARQRARERASVRTPQKLHPLLVAEGVGVAILMVAVLLCYIRINSISRNIVDMKKQIEQLEVEQVSLLTRYEQAFDLTSVKETAEAAGMTQPSDSQIYYIDLPGENRAEAYSDTEVSAVSRFFRSVQKNASRLLEYFQ